MTELSVATWNTFLDKRYPQNQRIDEIVSTLSKLDNARPLSAVALQEIQAVNGQHNGTYLADQLVMEGEFVPHSRRKQGEHIGLIGNELTWFDSIELGHGKSAVKAYLGGIAIVSVHLRKQPQRHFPRGNEQVEQVTTLLNWLEDDDTAIVKGDWNCLPFQQPRRMVEKAGFHSVFADVPAKRRATVPTSEFIDILSDSDRRAARVFGRWLNVDDIYIRNLTATAAGYEQGKSDHALVWATVVDA